MKSSKYISSVSCSESAGFGSLVINFSGWMLLFCYLTTLWIWGGTRPWTIAVISWMLLLSFCLYITGLISVRRWPRIPLMPSLAVAVLLLEGWWHIWRIYSRMQPQEQSGDLIPMITPFADLSLATDTMLLITGLLGAFCIACDLSANRQWVMRLWITIAVGGISIVALGLAQRITHAPAIFWNAHEDTGSTFFGVYRYHANAGSLLNLVFPMISGLAVLSIRRDWNQAARALFVTGSLITITALFVNVSRGAFIVTGIMLLLSIFWCWSRRSSIQKARFNAFSLGVVAILLAVTLLIMNIGIGATVDRWHYRGFFDVDRYLTYRSIINYLLPESGYFGFGPGSFAYAFKSVVEAYDLPIRGSWMRAHNDHLQTIVEWGWIGYLGWGILIMGALWRGIASFGSNSVTIRIFSFCASISLFGVIIHACIDFPLQISSLQLCTVLIVGMLWGITTKNNAASRG